MRAYGTYGRLLAEWLTRWAATGETPTAHVVVGKVDGLPVFKTVRDAPRAVLCRCNQYEIPTEYKILACQIELARRGPPQGWSFDNVVGWICYDAKEGWRPLLGGRKTEDEVF